MLKITIPSILIALLLFSCASQYHVLNPPGILFDSLETSDPIQFRFKYDILTYRSNTKLAKKEDKKGIKILGIEITNNSGTDLIFDEDIKVKSGTKTVRLMDVGNIHDELKQNVPIYLIYLVLTPLRGNINNSDGGPSASEQTLTVPYGYALGPLLAGINMGVAAKSNNKFFEDLEMHNLKNRIIKNGETVQGIIGIKATTNIPLKISY